MGRTGFEIKTQNFYIYLSLLYLPLVSQHTKTNFISKLRYDTYILLFVLGGGVASAQTHSVQPCGRKPAVVRKHSAQSLSPVTSSEGKYWFEARSDCSARHLVEDVVPFDIDTIFTYAEEMPILNGQHYLVGSRQAIYQLMALSPSALPSRIFVQFEVDKQGHVSHPKILKGLRADADSAVISAIQKLPSFTPGKIAGHPVRMRLTVDVTIPAKN